MRLNLIKLAKNLLIYWLINFLLISILMLAIVFIISPLVMMITTNTFSMEFFPNMSDVHKSIHLVFIVAFWSGLILWVKGEFFTKR